MTNSKQTKRALFSSVVALLICFTMLLGTTFAWFTDTASTGVNKIQAGNLDLEVYYAYPSDVVDGDIPEENWKRMSGDTPVFNNEALWEPGYAEVVFFKFDNAGSLAFQYQFNVDIIKEVTGKTKTGKDIQLSNYIQAYACNSFSWDYRNFLFTDRGLAVDPTSLGAPVPYSDTLFNAANGAVNTPNNDNPLSLDSWQWLDPTETTYATLVLWMPTTVTNEANHDGTHVPSIDLGIHVLATQYNWEQEKDSFDHNYDQDAQWPVIESPADTWDGTADTSWYNDNDTEFTLNSAEALAGLATLVESGNNLAGKTFKLDADIDLASIPFNPIGHYKNGLSFNGTFDGQGHTISNMYEQSDLDAWQYEGEYYGLFAYTVGATIKNVTIADAYVSSGRNEAAGVVGNAVDTTFSDITISNTTLIAYNNTAGGIAAECYGNCSFTNIIVDEDTVVGPLWGTYDAVLGGVVGAVGAGDNVTFSNVTVACRIDAINDVAGNDQYWQYRRCGMLIGRVDSASGVADPTGYVTCENVTVTYGDWVNYHYCEYASLGAGSYNGPGEYKYARVEAGTGTGGIDLSTCNHNEDESHNVLIVFDQLFGGNPGVSGLKTYAGVTVNYPNS